MRTRLHGDVHAPAAARRFVVAALGDLTARGPGPDPDDVVLVVSELVTNSVRAGAEDIGVEVVVLEDCVELSVSDDAAGWPRLHHAGLGDVDGRGLEIVAKLADDWRATSLAGGKRVTVSWSRSD